MSDFDPVVAAAQLRQSIIDDEPRLFAENKRLRELLRESKFYVHMLCDREQDFDLLNRIDAALKEGS